MTRRAVCTSYDMVCFPAMDDKLTTAVGRPSDFAGSGMGRRDHGWVVHSDDEAIRVGQAVADLGLFVDVREDGQF
mgnify:CR=1 FL=1